MSAFHLFPLLPAELRLEIWHYACVSPSPHPCVCTLPATLAAPPIEAPWQGWAKPKLKVLCAPPRALYQTSREARSVAAGAAFTRPYHAATDILYVPSAQYELFFGQLLGEWGPRWPRRVRRLTLPRTGKPWGRTHDPYYDPADRLLTQVSCAASQMKRLESISVVYAPPPRCSGETRGEGGRAGVPRYWEGARLRLLEDEEMGLMANDVCEEEAGKPSGGDSVTGYISGRWPFWQWHPVQPDEQEADQQMESIGEEMARFEDQICWWGDLRQKSKMWIEETGEFRVRFEPRCFI